MGANSRIIFTGIAAGLLLSLSAYAQESSYDQLVSQARTDLNAGDAAKALADSKKAIKAAPTRWEAYVVAGGALQTERQYDKAIVDFSQALDHAPQTKKSAVRALLQKAVAEQTGAQSNPQSVNASATSGAKAGSSGPSYADTVAWITNNIAKAGVPGASYLRNDPDGGFEQSSDKYSVGIDGCTSFTIVNTNQTTARIQDPDGSWTNEQYGLSTTFIFDINHVAFSDPSAANGDLGIMALDNVGRWHYHNVNSNGGAVDDQSETLAYSAVNWDHFQDSGGARFLAPSGSGLVLGTSLHFKLPGTEDLAPRLVAAFRRLQQICKEHPEQAPKQPF